MLKRAHLIAATALCGLTLGLLPARTAHAAAAQTVTFQMTDVAFALAWVDSGNGSTINQNVAKTFHDQYVGTTWTVVGNSAKVTTSDGKTLVTVNSVQTQDGTQFFLHERSGSATIDGTIFRGEPQSDGSTDMTKGWAELYLVLPSKDGKSWASVHLAGPLTFSDGGTPTPTPTPFGGGF
jgi:hypothetical protein